MLPGIKGMLIALIAMAALSSAPRHLGGSETHRDASFWMKKKMEYSQAIFEGIANEDFDQIIDNAESMRSLSRIEHFVRRRNSAYKAQLQIFQAAARDIVNQANRQNLEGTTLAFTQLTISCVKCHQTVRGSHKTDEESGDRESDSSAGSDRENKSSDGHDDAE